MRKTIITLSLAIACYSSKAQKFFIPTTDKGIEQKVREKMDYESYNLVKDEKEADYKVECLIQTVSTANLKYKGYVRIIDLKTGKEVGRTKEVHKKATAFRGYNAANAIFKTIADDYLDEQLKKCISKS